MRKLTERNRLNEGIRKWAFGDGQIGGGAAKTALATCGIWARLIPSSLDEIADGISRAALRRTIADIRIAKRWNDLA